MTFDVDAKQVSFQSQFGGFWTDVTNAEEILAGKLALGNITEAEAELLHFWIKNGYAVIPSAISEAAIEAAKASISRIYEQGGAIAETYEFGDVRNVWVEARHRAMQHKLIDAYAHDEAIREMIMSEKLIRFLNIVFERPAMAFQSLYFENGSQQSIHRDTAYVRVNRPMELVGTWIAMEDIQEGSGELEYFVGSHRIQEFLFDGTAKWMPYGSKQHPEFLAHLQTEASRLGLRREQFRPKKGDALIWSADLCHGGSKVTNPTTRRSFVTHFCPVSADPFYFTTHLHTDKIKVSDQVYYTYSFHGHPGNPYLN